TEEIKKQQKEEKGTKTITKKEKGFFDDPVVKSMTRTAGNTIVRSLLGALGLGGRSRRKSLF
ncbi:MAG: helicase HerA-like domain-containing protein, partial [Chitinophagaceae bacterium]